MSYCLSLKRFFTQFTFKMYWSALLSPVGMCLQSWETELPLTT